MIVSSDRRRSGEHERASSVSALRWQRLPIQPSNGPPPLHGNWGWEPKRLRHVEGWIGHGTVLFIMLNPSTATDILNDPTIRRCIGFAQRWGYAKLLVGNAYRGVSILFKKPPPGVEPGTHGAKIRCSIH